MMRSIHQDIADVQMQPRSRPPPVRATPGVQEMTQVLFVPGSLANVVAAATVDVDVPLAMLVCRYALQHRLQQLVGRFSLELWIYLSQEAPFLLDILPVDGITIDEQRVDPQRDVLDKVLPALP